MLATQSFFQSIPQSFDLEYLLLGGGGGGGGNDGGGGAGGYRLGSDTLTSETSGGTHVAAGTRESPVELTKGVNYNITLGAGGANGDPGTKGGDTTFIGTGVSLTAYGGGGGSYNTAGTSTNIGSGGGGSSRISQPNAGVVTDNTDQGFNGGPSDGSAGTAKGGGGGGAGAIGVNKLGGAGLSSSITGSAVPRGGGGGGSASGWYAGGGGTSSASQTDDVRFGGGDGDTDNAAANRGGGGGGGHNISARPGSSGVIVLKVPDTITATFESGVTSTTITSVSGYNIYNITAVTTTKTVTFS